MADPLYNSYFSPLDNLIGSPMIGSRKELQAEQAIRKGVNSFENVLNDYQSSYSSSKPKSSIGCDYPLIPINCDSSKSVSQSRENIQAEIETAMNNITNADKPGYKRVLPYKDENGNPIYDETPGKLEKTEWHLDLAISGKGQGFQLANGEFTRDGRFKFDAQGKMVTVDKEIPLEVCYKDGAPIDWSLKQLTIDSEGKVFDKNNGKELGFIKADFDPKGKIVQHYIERSNVNLPVEFMGISQKFRLLELTNNLFSTGTRLNNEAVQILRNL